MNRDEDHAGALKGPTEAIDRSRRIRRTTLALVVATAMLVAGIASARRIGIRVHKPANMACMGTPIKVGVRAKGAARAFRITILNPAKKRVFSKKSRARKKWKYWLYSPTTLGTFKTEYRTALGKRRFTTQVTDCQGPVASPAPPAPPPSSPAPPPPTTPPPPPPPPPSCGAEVCLFDNDADTAMFSMSNMAPGTTESCIRISYAGSLTTNVRLYGTTTGSGLDNYLNLKITRGIYAPTEPAFRSCSNFVPDVADYGLGPGGVIYLAALRDFPDGYDTGRIDPLLLGIPEPWTDGESHVYRFEITLQDNNSAQGLNATQAFTWEARDVP
jgi:hypothetical protein